MATKTINRFITDDLDWAENQLFAWKEYVDNNPLHVLKDRMSYKETKGGGVIPMCVATIEAQGKFIQETMKNYLQLLENVNRLREQDEAKKKTVKGDASIPHRMQKGE